MWQKATGKRNPVRKAKTFIVDRFIKASITTNVL
jgi:hypothetical protein